jgi:hypothetical protein
MSSASALKSSRKKVPRFLFMRLTSFLRLISYPAARRFASLSNLGRPREVTANEERRKKGNKVAFSLSEEGDLLNSFPDVAPHKQQTKVQLSRGSSRLVDLPFHKSLFSPNLLDIFTRTFLVPPFL